MIRLGIICPSEIALRRFMPALMKNKDFTFAGIAAASSEDFYFGTEYDNLKQQSILNQEKEKAREFINKFGGKLYNGYTEIAASPEIDALYIPLPPALHYKWAKFALEHNKHVLVEKPATLELAHTLDLIELASANSLALHENYMFAFHDQIKHINSIVKNGELGDVRLYRISFGFPRREQNDFRYKKELGGGALYDAGGYTIKYASMLLGDSAKLMYSRMNYIDDFEVDIYGSAALINEQGVTVQAAYGMDNSYRCELEVWGSTGILTTGRILTAPDGFIPEAVIKSNNEEKIIKLPADDTFAKSINWLYKCICDNELRETGYKEIKQQALLIDKFIKCETVNT